MHKTINLEKLRKLGEIYQQQLKKVEFLQSKPRLKLINDRYLKCSGKEQLEKTLSNTIKNYITELGFIDCLYYKYSSKELSDFSAEPVNHFWDVGLQKLARPNLFFDTAYYMAANKDLAAAGVNPVFHFVKHGFTEGRSCHPTFCPYRYLRKKYQNEKPSLIRLMSDYYSGELFVEGSIQFGIRQIDFRILKLLRELDSAKSDDSKFESLRCSENPKVSIVIPVYNQLEMTLNCLLSLSLHPALAEWEIILIDDCSKSDVSEKLSALPQIRYVKNADNLGFLKSCNKAASLARGEYIVFLNNDTCPLPGWLDSMLQIFDQQSNAGLVGSKLVYPDAQLQEAGGLIWADASGTNCGKFQCADHPDYNYMRPVDYCSGASIMIPKQLWDQIGGFDERFAPAYYEDTDLAFVVREQGFEVLYQPTSEVIHFEGVSSGTDLSSGAKKYQVINQSKFKEKWSEQLKQHSEQVNHSALYSRKSKPLAVVIDQQTPTPDFDAGSVFSFNFIKLLSQTYQVDFLASEGMLYRGGYTQKLQELGVRCLYGPWFHYEFEKIRLDWKNIELVVLQRHNVFSDYIDTIEKLAPQAKILFLTIDLHFIRLERQAEIESSQELRLLAKRTKSNELSAMLRSDATVVLGAKETETVKEHLPTVKCYQLPIWEEVSTEVKPFDSRKDIFFLGGFNHPPNGDALTYFLEEVWPITANKLPGVKFYIYGSKIPKKFERYASDSVIIGGFVPELGPIFDRFRVNIAPLRYGAGQNGKVVASLCRGLPTVVSSVAAKGINLVHEEHTLIADSPEDFSKQIQRLYNDRLIWEQLSRHSLEFAREKLSVANAERILNTILSDIR
jgi:GT2 family glycosyltransferase/glycosyltransferase involved in cell wall biosynthesis